MELLNYSAPTTTTRQPDVETLMKLATPASSQSHSHSLSIIGHQQSLGRTGYDPNHHLNTPTLMPTPPTHSQNPPAHIQGPLYHYHSDSESNHGNTSIASANDYDYKESYSYMMNPPGSAQVEHYSPVASSYTSVHRPAGPGSAQSQPGPVPNPNQTHQGQPEPPHVQQPQYYPQGPYPQGPAQGHQHHSGQPANDDFKPPNPKGLSLPEIRPPTYYDDDAKYRANSVPAYHQNSNPHLHPQYPPQGNLATGAPQHHDLSYPPPPPPQNLLAIQVPQGIDVNQYPDMTTLLNANSNLLPPPVESQFVDHKSCQVCGKRITRDMSRHMRTHQSESRFSCKFPKNECRHKSGKFNRPYDYKKHLLNRHFKFDDPCVKRLHNLSDKLYDWGTCPCGQRFIGKDWLDKHILTADAVKRCPCIE